MNRSLGGTEWRQRQANYHGPYEDVRPGRRLACHGGADQLDASEPVSSCRLLSKSSEITRRYHLHRQASMEESLAKIRPHVSSSLLHQKKPATLLVALESTFKEQNTELLPTAYFAALLTTLEGTVQKNDVGLEEGDFLPAELYLLALVLPFVPTPVIRTHLTTLLSLTSPLFRALPTHAPPLRSQLSIYQTIFKTLDKSQLDSQAIRQSFASILQLCIDPRPKVRKKAADVVRDVLALPPAPLSRHPYAERVADWVKRILSEANVSPFAKIKHGKPPEGSGPDTAIHVLAFLRPVLHDLPATVSGIGYRFDS